MAYGLLELKPRELDKLQPHEFEKMLEGYVMRRDKQNEVQAYFTYLMVAPHVKKDSITVEKILKPLQPHKAKEVKQADREYFENLNRKLGGE